MHFPCPESTPYTQMVEGGKKLNQWSRKPVDDQGNRPPSKLPIILFSLLLGCCLVPVGNQIASAKPAQSVNAPPTKAESLPETTKEGFGEETEQWFRKLFKRALQVPDEKAQRALAEVLKHPEKFHFSILASTGEGQAVPAQLKVHNYRVGEEVIYPASAMKTFGSLGALMVFEENRKKHPWLSLNAPLKASSQQCKKTDRSNLHNRAQTLAHEIRKTQLVSSNAGFNFLFDLVSKKGFVELFSHMFPTVEMNRQIRTSKSSRTRSSCQSFAICSDGQGGTGTGERKQFSLPCPRVNAPLAITPSPTPTELGRKKPNMRLGKGQLTSSGKKKNKPMDFSYKNQVGFEDYQRLMMALHFPGMALPMGDPQSNRLLKTLPELISEPWLEFLRLAMAQYPRYSDNPVYPNKSTSETRFKPMISGIRLAGINDDDLLYSNKAGKALGFHLDNAYIAMGPKLGVLEGKAVGQGAVTRKLFITIGMYVNKNGILNDNQYQYHSISKPVLKAIGFAIGEYLQGRL